MSQVSAMPTLFLWPGLERTWKVLSLHSGGRLGPVKDSRTVLVLPLTWRSLQQAPSLTWSRLGDHQQIFPDSVTTDRSTHRTAETLTSFLMLGRDLETEIAYSVKREL